MKNSNITILLLLLITMVSMDVKAVGIARVNYTLNPNTLEATVCYRDYEGDITIPSVIKYEDKEYRVTSIDALAFYECSSLTSVTIPESVTAIGASAFQNCSSLTSVTIPESVTAIGAQAFWGCSSLTSVTFFGSVSIGSEAFAGCSELNKVIVPNIAAWCGMKFESNSSSYSNETSYTSNPLCYAHHLYSDTNTEITDLMIPEGVTSIGSSAFRGCSGLTSVTIPESVTCIGSEAFSGCSGLNKVIVPKMAAWCGITFESKSSSNTNGTSYTSNPLYYARHLYSDANTEITDLIIPEGVTSIGSSAFQGCSGLTSVAIPESVTSIGSSVFENCGQLSSVEINCKTIPSGMFNYVATLKNVVIGATVKSIGSKAFSGCSGLTSVTISENVTWIGSEAFANCTGLKKVVVPNVAAWCGIWFESNTYGTPYTSNPLCYAHHLYSDADTEITDLIIPDGVTSIKSSAFRGCSGLTSVTFSGSASIGSEAFYDCSGLTSVVFSGDVTSIGSEAFSGCNGLKKVIVPNVAAWCKIEFASTSYGTSYSLGYSSNPLSYAHRLYSDANTEITDLIIPDGVTSISSLAFAGCSGLTSVTIPRGVSIGSSAFRNCSGLISVTMSGGASIGTSAFYGCNGLTSVAISRGASIGSMAFYGCKGLTSLTILGNVTSIGSEAFRNCSGLTSVALFGNLATIGSSAFYGCSGLTSVALSGSVTSIGSSAFQNCKKIIELRLGESVEKIDSKAFDGCPILTRIYSEAVFPADCYADAFSMQKTNCKLYVKAGCEDIYRVHKSWCDFDIQTMDGESNYLSLRMGDGGVMKQAVMVGKPYTFELNADEGWEVYAVMFEGQDMTDQLHEGMFITPTITGDAELSVVFKKTSSNVKEHAAESPINVKVAGQKLAVSGVSANTPVVVYTIHGIQVDSAYGVATFVLDGGVYIVKVGDETFKVSL